MWPVAGSPAGSCHTSPRGGGRRRGEHDQWVKQGGLLGAGAHKTPHRYTHARQLEGCHQMHEGKAALADSDGLSTTSTPTARGTHIDCVGSIAIGSSEGQPGQELQGRQHIGQCWCALGGRSLSTCVCCMPPTLTLGRLRALTYPAKPPPAQAMARVALRWALPVGAIVGQGPQSRLKQRPQQLAG